MEGHDGDPHETDVIRPSSSCSSPEDQLYDGEEFVHTLDITDEFEYDGEVGKRLNQMVPAPVSTLPNVEQRFYTEPV